MRRKPPGWFADAWCFLRFLGSPAWFDDWYY